MKKKTISAIKKLLSTPQNIVIVSHKNPDGDAIGSSLALYHFLIKNRHKVTVIFPNNYPNFLKWLPGESQIVKYDEATIEAKKIINASQIIFTLDFNALSRSGYMEESLQKSKSKKIMIDHHQQPEDYATYTYSNASMSSTCEMVYNFINMVGNISEIDKNIATCIYVGIMTDTGSFRYRCTTSSTHKIVADLIEKGADNTKIHNAVYSTNTLDRLQLLGKALSNLKVLSQLNTAYITLSQEELNTFNFKKGDTEGVVNYALSIKNIVLAAIFIEDKKEGIIKISFRSKEDFSVNKLARSYFNGGGHNNAAGGRSLESLEDTLAKFISILPNYKRELQKC